MRSLGAYALEETVGAGGMCDVWRGRGPNGDVVAVKILRSEFSSELLRDEIHLMTSLHHPGIVAIRAWGDATAAEASTLDVPAGTPWVAMDYADRGSLDMQSVTTFREFRRLTISLLDALMHSHARGVIHRDIKPGNILVDGDPARYMLTDFGIAFPKSRVREGTYEVPMAAAGTMNYIAPEQLIGRWRDFNSYTDLFSLGVVLFEIITGELPFPGSSRVNVAMAQQRGMSWPDTTRFAVPRGIEEWLGMLIAHDPVGRFAFAADAAHALMELGEPPDDDGEAPPFAAFDDAITIPDAWQTTKALARRPPSGAPPRAAIHLSGPRPPVPDDWRPSWWGRDVRPRGTAGATAMIGREAERDELWSRLRSVIESERSQSVVIRGQDGLGASRLARWLCERAHEVGAADDIVVSRRHGASALADTMRHVLRLGGLDARERLERLRDLLGDVDVDLELVSQLALGLPLSVADQAYVIEAIMGHFSARRPLLIWVEDAHEDLELLEIATRATGSPHAVLFLLTTREESLPQLPYERAQLEALLRSDAATELRLGPMQPNELRELLARWPIEPAVVDELLRACAGNPLHTLQHATLLEAGGTMVAGGLNAVWLARLDLALKPAERSALRAAAVLGTGIDLALWARLCRRVALPFTDRLADRFIQTGLWTATSHGYTFVHPTLRDAVLAEPGAEAQIRALHNEAASLFNAEFAPIAPLRARHLVAAGRTLDAARVTYQAVFAFHGEARTAHARSVTEWFGRALDHAQVPPEHPARRWATLMKAYQPHEEGASEQAYEAVSALVDEAVGGEPTFLAEALRNLSFLETSLGESDRALATARRAMDFVGEVEPSFACGLHNRVGHALLAQADLEGALEQFERAATHDSAPLARIAANVGRAYALMELDRDDEARQLLAATVELARSLGARLQVGHVLNALADAERRRGNLDVAEQHYREVLRLVARADESAGHTARLNLALTIMKRSPGQAAALADEVRGQAGSGFLRAYAHGVLGVAAAHRGDRKSWDEHRPDFGQFRNVEYAEMWAQAAERWVAAGDLPRATQAFAVALSALESITHARATRLRDDILRTSAALVG